MSRFTKGDRVAVAWEDSVSIEGWVTVRAALSGRRKKVRCWSIGFVLADDKRGITLAGSIHKGNVSGIIQIPQSAVRSSRKLR